MKREETVTRIERVLFNVMGMGVLAELGAWLLGPFLRSRI